MVPKICTKNECAKRYYARGMCSQHYDRWRKTQPAEMLEAPTIEQRFWAKVNKSAACWEWSGTRGTYGHGQFKVNKKYTPAHRFSYELAKGPIPAGLVVDHICHHPPCVNPEHLRAVTHKQNLEHQIGAHANSRSGVRGVRPGRNGRWRAEVRHNNARYSVGSFDSLSEAEIAVTAKRNELFTHNDADRR